MSTSSGWVVVASTSGTFWLQRENGRESILLEGPGDARRALAVLASHLGAVVLEQRSAPPGRGNPKGGA